MCKSYSSCKCDVALLRCIDTANAAKDLLKFDLVVKTHGKLAFICFTGRALPITHVRAAHAYSAPHPKVASTRSPWLSPERFTHKLKSP